MNFDACVSVGVWFHCVATVITDVDLRKREKKLSVKFIRHKTLI